MPQLKKENVQIGWAPMPGGMMRRISQNLEEENSSEFFERQSPINSITPPGP
jgi:pyruvate/oxaloacetate carboxyltransferase